MAQLQGPVLKDWGKLQEDNAGIKIGQLYIVHIS
jgi:hypothetical protein